MLLAWISESCGLTGQISGVSNHSFDPGREQSTGSCKIHDKYQKVWSGFSSDKDCPKIDNILTSSVHLKYFRGKKAHLLDLSFRLSGMNYFRCLSSQHAAVVFLTYFYSLVNNLLRIVFDSGKGIDLLTVPANRRINKFAYLEFFMNGRSKWPLFDNTPNFLKYFHARIRIEYFRKFANSCLEMIAGQDINLLILE